MATYSKDRGSRSISVGPAIPKTSGKENSNTTPANPGTQTGPGDAFIYVTTTGAGYQYPPNMSWDVSQTGGGGALVAILEGSDDGFVTKNVIDTINDPNGGSKSVANPGMQAYRINVTTYTNGVVVGGITI